MFLQFTNSKRVYVRWDLSIIYFSSLIFPPPSPTSSSAYICIFLFYTVYYLPSFCVILSKPSSVTPSLYLSFFSFSVCFVCPYVPSLFHLTVVTFYYFLCPSVNCKHTWDMLKVSVCVLSDILTKAASISI